MAFEACVYYCRPIDVNSYMFIVLTIIYILFSVDVLYI